MHCDEERLRAGHPAQVERQRHQVVTLRHIATRKMKAAGRSVPKNRPLLLRAATSPRSSTRTFQLR
jgi:hypothetical protein